MRVCVCWSGGKNSTRAVMEYHQRGYKVTAVCYIPMFKESIPLIDLEHYNFILRCASWFKSIGIRVVFLKGITYFDYCTRILKRGKFKGNIQGFPLFMKGKCGFARDGKIKTINAYFSKHERLFSKIDIGLCADEYDRKVLKGKECSILRELGIKDSDCFYWCRDYQLLSPKYKDSFRDGCLLCPHAKPIERIKFFNAFPEVFEDILYIQRLQKEKCSSHYPLRGRHWFIENDEFICGYGSQLSVLDDFVIY